MKSDFGESMFWLAETGRDGDGSPQRVRPSKVKISRARQKPNSLLFFACIFRIVEPTNNEGKA
ncbi:hypothetical protein GGD57_001871 [Rhizobium esperanzae]|uniref:Uncharacterized protein n=1 Tax=Rhizobium esperanzae TaxID=1967781 RepID=A0A7W6R1T7_9HYPH|nr:hypothetical protein [Rhizobium esperanzae]